MVLFACISGDNTPCLSMVKMLQYLAFVLSGHTIGLSFEKTIKILKCYGAVDFPLK